MSPEKKKQGRPKKSINPKITDIEYGIREKKTIKMYPLSWYDQTQSTKLISEAISGFFAVKEQEDADPMTFAAWLVKLITDNIRYVFKLAVGIEDDEKIDEILKDIDNEQMVEFADKFIKINYSNAIKNSVSLFSNLKTLFSPLKRLSQQSVNDTQDTGSNTSTEKASEKGE